VIIAVIKAKITKAIIGVSKRKKVKSWLA